MTKSELSIAIHNGEGWNSRWRQYCIDQNIPYKVVCCYDSDILDQIRDCSGLMWFFHHARPQDILMARNVLNAAELMGLKVFPNFHTNWHFDDKLSQKFLFEALDLPAAPAWAFFDFDRAMEFADSCEIPIVAKLRRGAGSYNVRLLKSRGQVRKYIKRMFGEGYSPSPLPLADAKTKFKVAMRKGGLKGVLNRLKKAPEFFRVVTRGRKYFGNEKGYVYFQKFIPGNTCDYRIKVVGDRAWGFRRMVRENDFRASGSGILDFDYRKIPAKMILTAFESADKLKMQSVAFDFVMDREGKPLIVEISYGFDFDEGESDIWWDRSLKQHTETFDPTHLILKTFLQNF